jgi:hypothetical protein
MDVMDKAMEDGNGPWGMAMGIGDDLVAIIDRHLVVMMVDRAGAPSS